MKSFLIQFFLLLCFICTPLTAQTKNSAVLKMADSLSLIWQQERAAADSFAQFSGIPVRFQTPEGVYFELQKVKGGFPVYLSTDNSVSSSTISTDKNYSNGFGGFNLSGAQRTIGLWDAGKVLTNHIEFQGRVSQKDGSTEINSHATHVAGTLVSAGVDSAAKGMSFSSSLNAYDWSNDYAEILQEAANGLRISNHSYGMSMGWTQNYRNDGRWAWLGNTDVSPTQDYKFGFYDNYSRDLDNVMYNAPYLLSFRSAGNHRGEGPLPGTEHWVFKSGVWTLSNDIREIDGGQKGYDCMGSYSSSKNIVTVGAVYGIPGGYKKPSDVVISSFSSWGPLDDGRIKPDIVTDGVDLYSTASTGINQYRITSGTSTAAPSAAGSAGLIVQQQAILYGNNDPFRASAIKALIIHTADEAGTSEGPDYTFGWGLMNTLNAVKLLTIDHESGGNKLIKEENLMQGYNFEYDVITTGGLPLKATICWHDPPATVSAPVLNNPQPKLINDLDIRIIGPGNTYLPWILDLSDPAAPAARGDNYRDNVEQVFIPSAPEGNYKIRISHKGILQGGNQFFSLIVSGISLPLPEQVQLISPADNASNLELRPEFEWRRSSRSSEFRIQIAIDSLFTETAADTVVPFIKTKISGDLYGSAKFFWRVRGANSGGEGVWSEVRSFTTKPGIPSPPEIIYPLNNGFNVKNNSLFKWKKSSGAEYYHVQISDSSAFNSIIFNDSTISDTSVMINILLELKKYFWRVGAINNFGHGVFSHIYNFTSAIFPPDSLAGEISNSSILLTWRDRSQLEEKYFVLRNFNNSVYQIIDTLPPNSLSYLDENPGSPGLYTYRVFCQAENINSDSAEAEVNYMLTSNEADKLPEYNLSQNFPNPFNSTTIITFSIRTSGEVILEIYNSLGEVIYDWQGYKQAGKYEVVFSADNLPSGIYFYRLRSGDYNNVGKMILLR